MSANITKHSPNPRKFKLADKTVIEEFKLHMVTEVHHSVMIILFFIAAFIIYFQIKITLITLFNASQLFVLFGLAGFAISFVLRKHFGLSILDGLYYNAFAVAPITMALFLWANTFCSDDYTETHQVVGLVPGGRGYVYELENEAYSDYWRIRNISEPPANLTNAAITFTFCDGLFGYKVLQGTKLD